MKNSRFTFRHTIRASYLGYITQAVVNNLAPLLFTTFNKSLKIPLEKITLLVTVNFLIQLCVDLLSSKFIDKIGYRASIVMSHILCAAGLVLMAVLPFLFADPFAGLLISVVLYAVGGGIIEVLISPIVEACPTENKVRAMSLLHSFYCWGTVGVVALSTVFLRLAGRGSWRILCVLWACLPVFNAFYFSRVPVNTLGEKEADNTKKPFLKEKAFILFFILMMTAGASEQAMSQWASAFAESGLGVSKTAGDLAGPCMFSLLMGASRVIGAKLSGRVKLSALMTASGIICAGAYLLAALSKSSVVSLFGCALCGFSVGIMWPGTFSMASRRFKNGGTSLFALLALAGDLGCMSGPTLVGAIASSFSDNLKTGLLFAVIFPVLLTASCLVLNKDRG